MKLSFRAICALVIAALPLGEPRLVAQIGRQGDSVGSHAVFVPLLADPKQPQFTASSLVANWRDVGSHIVSVGLGQTIPLARAPSGRWDLGVAAGVFSQFNLSTPSFDLVNSDFLVGLPFAVRWGGVVARAQVYHQSSHLGDEYLLHTHAVRVDYSYEAMELLVANARGAWRFYGGGEILFHHDPSNLPVGLLHGGLEYRGKGSIVRLGVLGAGRVVVGVDNRSFQTHAWRSGWSVRTGLQFVEPSDTAGNGEWRWAVFLQGYDGPAPFGQFYPEDISAAGLGISFRMN